MKQSTPTRRRFLAGSAAAGVVGLAGCGALGGGGGNGDGSSGNGNGNEGRSAADVCADGYEVTFEQPGASVSRADDGTLPAPSLGPDDASVTVMAFEDHRCPHCRTYSMEVFPAVKCQYIDSGDIRYEFRDLPVVNNESWRSASAARAVQNTVGNGAYWAYSKLLFENQNSLGPDTYASLAEEVDADPDTVRTAAVEEAYRPTVEADRSMGIDMGVESTPTIVVDGELVSGNGYESVSSAIDSAL